MNRASLLKSIKNAMSSLPSSKGALDINKLDIDMIPEELQLSGNSKPLATEKSNTKSSAALRTQVPVLRCFNVHSTLAQEDFQQLCPEVPIKQVIRGRHALNLMRSDAYFLVFKDVTTLQEYHGHFARRKPLLNQDHVGLKPANDLVNQLRFLYPKYLPDLDDLPALVLLGKKSRDHDKHNDFNSVQKSLDQLLHSRRLDFKRYASTEVGLELARIASQLQQGDKIAYPTIKRDSCVILKNFPANITHQKITDFLWDLGWNSATCSAIREVFVDNFTNLSTLVLIFDNNADAVACVERTNNYHLFYDPALPVVSSEIL